MTATRERKSAHVLDSALMVTAPLSLLLAEIAGGLAMITGDIRFLGGAVVLLSLGLLTWYTRDH